jgi:hypothetical protein
MSTPEELEKQLKTKNLAMKRIFTLATVLIISLGTTAEAGAERWTVPQCIAVLEMAAKASGRYQADRFEEAHQMMKQYFISRGDFDDQSWRLSKNGGAIAFSTLVDTDLNKARAISDQCGRTIKDAVQRVTNPSE